MSRRRHLRQRPLQRPCPHLRPRRRRSKRLDRREASPSERPAEAAKGMSASAPAAEPGPPLLLPRHSARQHPSPPMDHARLRLEWPMEPLAARRVRQSRCFALRHSPRVHPRPLERWPRCARRAVPAHRHSQNRSPLRGRLQRAPSSRTLRPIIPSLPTPPRTSPRPRRPPTTYSPNHTALLPRPAYCASVEQLFSGGQPRTGETCGCAPLKTLNHLNI